MPGADSQPQLAASIRARRRAMAEGRAASDDPEVPEREASIPPVSRTQSMFLRMRTDTYYQDVGTLLHELYSSPTKVLLVFAPVGIIAGFLRLHPVVIFALNLVALVPLSALILYSVLVFTADYALLGGLLRAVFGNATELAVRTRRTWQRDFVELTELRFLARHMRFAAGQSAARSMDHDWEYFDILSLCATPTRAYSVFVSNLRADQGALRRCLASAFSWLAMGRRRSPSAGPGHRSCHPSS
ncbi:Vacuolar membrane antiporter [Metarhizium acridum]|uniref:Vacuolar membrane antiporter n=1 Tax=Metarhizium acridum TaxID=92637 RepID=UPI001C6C6881|nr:Vacuolar membrane antiporter [Metarhizium acridum]